MSSQYVVHVACGSSYFIFQNIITNLIVVIAFAVLTRLIATEDMGILAVLSLVSGICTTIGELSLPNAVIKFVAECLARGERDSAASVFYQSLRTTLIVTLPLAIAVYFAASILSTLLLHQASYAIYFRYLAFDIILSCGLTPVLAAALLGLHKFKQQASIQVGYTVIRQSLIIMLIILLHSFLGLVVAWVLADLVLVLVCLVYVVADFRASEVQLWNQKTSCLLVAPVA